MSEHEQKNDPWANLADTLGAKPVAKPAAPPAAATPPAPARPPQKPRDEKPTPAVRSDWGGLASALGLEPAGESKPAAQSSRPQPAKPLPPADPPARQAVEPPQRRSERERDEFSFGSRRPAAESAAQQSREPIDSVQRRDPPRSQRTEESASSEAFRSETIRSGGERSESAAHDRTDRTDRDRTDRTNSDRTDSDSAPRAGEDEQGAGRGRRRRGRRGGRGRGRRDEGRDRPLSGQSDGEHGSDTRTPSERLAAGSEAHEGFERPLTDEAGERLDRAPMARESNGPDDGEPRRDTPGEGDRDGESAPRRRRRGRRGGRRRGRGDREGEVGGVRSQADREGGEPPRRSTDGESRIPAGDATGDFDDEPLPAGYGVRQPARPADAPRSDSSRTGGGDATGTAKAEDREPGEAGGRRRRRRRRGEGRGSSAGSGTSASSTEGGREGSTGRRSTRSAEGSGQRRGRRSRRSGGEERRSASTFDRGRRDEFAPVAGGREEDDEGLEFLGIEDAGHDGRTRDDRHPADDDDSIIESGLNDVLDVPSWVEAIGIVIAGNLDARSRSPRGSENGNRGGEPRGDSSPRSGSSERSRDARRGGRSGDQR